MSLTWPSFSLSLRFPIIVFSSIWRLFHVKTVSFFSGSHFDGFKIWRCEDWRGFKGISVKQRETNFSLSPWFPIYSSFRPFCPTGNIMPLRLALLPASFPLSFPPRNSHYTISVLFLSSSSLLHITSSFRIFFLSHITHCKTTHFVNFTLCFCFISFRKAPSQRCQDSNRKWESYLPLFCWSLCLSYIKQVSFLTCTCTEN